MPSRLVLGVDIGTSSSKGVLVDMSGRLVNSATRKHSVERPQPGWVEMDATIWWEEFVAITRELLAGTHDEVTAVGVSGMGPCVLLTDQFARPVRPAILYGVDTRAGPQITRLVDQLGADEIMNRCGSALSSQAAGPKIAWIADNEPELFAQARRFFMSSSWLVYQLTETYLLDQHSASQCTPMYDTEALAWYRPWADLVAQHLELPPLQWSTDVAGVVTSKASRQTGLPQGIPVVTGTIDAWAEAVSVGAHGIGDLMLMYGTTMFLVNTVPEPLVDPALWGTVGALPDTRNLAGGMATSGSITEWLRSVFSCSDYASLMCLAEEAGAGANGLLMLPYFAGERTPIMDPLARGALIGLTLTHTRGDIYRAALEAIGFGVRHNVEKIEAAGGIVRRIVAVGGGTQGSLWTQVVSDILQRPQELPAQTIGASFGAAFLASQTIAQTSIAEWNPLRELREPRMEFAKMYDQLYALYLDLYGSTRSISHELAALQERRGTGTPAVTLKESRL